MSYHGTTHSVYELEVAQDHPNNALLVFKDRIRTFESTDKSFHPSTTKIWHDFENIVRRNHGKL